MSTETVVDVVMGIQVERQGLTVVVVGAEEGGIITLREKMEMEIGEITIPEVGMEVGEVVVVVVVVVGEASLAVKRMTVQADGVVNLEVVVVVGEMSLAAKRAARMVVGERRLVEKRAVKTAVGEIAAVADGEES